MGSMPTADWKRSRLVRVAVAAAATFAAGTALPAGTGGAAVRTKPVPARQAGHAAGHAAQTGSPASNAKRELGALRRAFGSSHGLLTDMHPRRHPYTTLWPDSQALNAAIAVNALDYTRANLTYTHSAIQSLSRYWDPHSSPPGYDSSVRPPLGPGGPKFYDDNMWIGLDLLQQYRLTHNPVLLAQAEKLFTFVKHGWDNNPANAFPGGVFWTQKAGNHDRNTVTTAGGAQFAFELYLITGRSDYFNWAQAMSQWVDMNLKSPDGLYWDHVDLQGGVNRMQWSYNQGLMIGVKTLNYMVTGNSAALFEAQSIAQTALATDGINSQPVAFDARFFQSLMLLNAVAPNPAYLQALLAYDAHLQSRTNRRTGLLGSRGPLKLLSQAAAVEVNAYLAMTNEGIARRWIPRSLH
jgi:Glycosyl hydrolase family 76